MTARRRRLRIMWRCITCTAAAHPRDVDRFEMVTPDPCRVVGHRSERMIRVGGKWNPYQPREVKQAVEVANGVALVPVGDA